MSEIAYSFGNDPPWLAERATVGVTNLDYDFNWVGHYPGHSYLVDSVILKPPSIDRTDYEQALDDINRTWGVINDPVTDKTFEVAIANLTAPEGAYDAELSTYTSSLSGNPGNAVEFAENAALHPDTRRLYISSFGNGGSSYWSKPEQRHIRRTGRFTYGNGEALPTIKSLCRALKAADFMITRFSANSAGGAYATGLMAALPEGQVSRAYLKSRPNVSNHPDFLRWGARMLVGDILDDRKYDKVSRDEWKMTGQLVEEAKQKVPQIYSKAAKNRRGTLFRKARSSHSAGKMLTDLMALSRGSLLYSDPAARDTVNALQRQPEALLTYHFPAQDRLYESPDIDIKIFLDAAYDIGRTAASSLFTGQLEALIMPGRHRDHTKYPSLRWAAEKYAFDRHVDLDRV